MTRRRALLPVVAISLGVVVAAAPWPASGDVPATAYVSVDGTGTTCTQDAPCGSISAALSVATSGATVLLEPGSYVSQKLGWHPNVTGFAQQVVIKPDQAGTVTLAGLDLNVSNVVVRGVRIDQGGVRIAANNITVDGIDVNGEGIDGGPTGGQGAGISVSGTTTNLLVTNSTIEGMVDRDGIDVGDGADPETNLTFTNNRIIGAIEGSLGHHTDCFQLYGGQTDVTLTGNLFGGCTVSELMLQAATAPIDNVLIAGNYLIACATPGSNSCDYFTIYVDPLNGNTITHLTIRHNTITGSLSLVSDPVSFTANILTGNLGGNVCGGNWESGNLIGVAPSVKACPTGLTGSGDRLGLPTFVDPADWDYRLAPGSLGHGLGVPVPRVPTPPSSTSTPTPSPPPTATPTPTPSTSPTTTPTTKPTPPPATRTTVLRVMHVRLTARSVRTGGVLRVTVGAAGHPLRHVKVSVGHRVAFTNAAGHARLRLRHITAGHHYVRCLKVRYRRARLRFSVR